MQHAYKSVACNHAKATAPKSSRLYATAMSALGFSLVVPATQAALNLGPLTWAGSHTSMQALAWLPLIAAGLSQLLVGLVLIAVAARYLLGLLHVPEGSVAASGRTVSAWGLGAMAGFLIWQAVDGEPASLPLMGVLSSMNFGSALLMAGVALVEGSRLVEIAREVARFRREHPSWQDTHVDPHAPRHRPRRPLIDLRLGRCPNCKRRVSMSAVRCHSCRAFFGRNAKWKIEKG